MKTICLTALTALCLATHLAHAETPLTPDDLYLQGAAAFKRGEIDRSLEAFDALLELAPQEKPRLWQRGISLYYAGRFEECVAQFESHRTVNPGDAENSVWHYLCVAALDGEDAARARFFPARDPRVPMMAIHRLFAGDGDVDSVFAEAAGTERDPTQERVAMFYAHLYVALWFESRGDAERTRRHLEQALDGSEVGHYMEDVARVHLRRIVSGKHRHRVAAHVAFFERLRALCGARFEGQSSFPEDPGDAFRGKTLVAVIETCGEEQIRIPFTVGEDTSRTWILTRTADGLELKHDHRHADGTPDEITMYGGTTSSPGTESSQTFPADEHTAAMIPEATTNAWSLTLADDGAALTYYLERHGRPRFEATLKRVR